MTLEIGQELWFVPRERRDGKPHPVTITKIGRKWAEVDRGYYRIDINTLVADGGQYASPGRCWLNQSAWEEEEARQSAWDSLKKYFDRAWTAPEDFPRSKMEEILAMLPSRS